MREADDTARIVALAEKHLSTDAEAQLVSLLFQWILDDEPAWMPPEEQRALWPTEERMGWLAARPEVRARVVEDLTGVSAGAAERLDLTTQVELIDAVVDEGDTSLADWARAWRPEELGAHAQPGAVHARLREAFPWNQMPTDETRAYLARWLEALLSSGDGNGRSRKPVLSPLTFRMAIDGEIWQESLPVAVRARVDAERLKAERKKRPFGAVHELAIISIQTLVEHISARAFVSVLELGEKALAARHSSAVEGDTEITRVDHTEEVPRA